MLASHFKVEFDQLIVQRVLRSRLTSKLADIKLESSEAYLLKLEKKINLRVSTDFYDFLHP